MFDVNPRTLDSLQQFRNAIGKIEGGIRDAAEELPQVAAGVEELQDTKGSEAKDALLKIRLHLGYKTLALRQAFARVESLAKQLETLAGPEAVAEAGKPPQFVERDGRTVARPGSEAPAADVPADADSGPLRRIRSAFAP